MTMSVSSPAKLRSAAAGMVIRQALDPAATDLTNSPDIIVTGPGAAFDTDAFTDPAGYNWYFSQAPAVGSANYVYIRGTNHNPMGTQDSRVYLYWAQSDQVLDPTKWGSSGFTVGGVAQNVVSIGAVSQWQVVLAQYPVKWTPPAATTAGATYYLITWVDNSASPTPPVFPKTPFADMAALTAYVQNKAQMAVLDTIYRGAFLRQFPAQTVTADGTGAQTCPDIIVTGTTAAQDASAFAQTASYNAGSLSQQAGLGASNFVYPRAINTRNGPGTSRVYLYWATTTDIAPTAWAATGFSRAGQPCNWADLTATTAGQLMVSTVPLVWNPPVLGQGSYVLIAYVDNSDSPNPPDFTAFGYVNAQAVTAFVSQHPQLAWLAITGSAAPAATARWNVPLVATAASVYVGFQLHGIPTDGTITLSVPGPDASNTIVVPTMAVPNPNVLVAWPLNYPVGFATSAVLTYTQGQTPPAQSFSANAVMFPRSTG